MKSRVYFGDERITQSYFKLRDSNAKDQELFRWIEKATIDLQKDAFCGIQIAKRLIPKIYIKKFGIQNLWKYNMPRGWRLLYSVSNNEVCIITIILEWMDHKEYERRFKY